MSNAKKMSSYRQKVKKVELALRRKNSSLEKKGSELGFTKGQVYSATRSPEPQHGNRYEVAVKLGIIKEEEPA